MLDVLAAQCVAMVGTMQNALVTVEPHSNARTRQRLDRRAEMIEQRLDLTPVNVGADRIVKDRAQQILVLVAQGLRPAAGRDCQLIR